MIYYSYRGIIILGGIYMYQDWISTYDKAVENEKSKDKETESDN